MPTRSSGGCSQDGVWDEHELTHMMFEFGEEEGTRKMAELTEDEASSLVLPGRSGAGAEGVCGRGRADPCH